jgi:hypothetical protein
MKDGIVECVFFWLLFAQAYRKKEMRMSFIGSSFIGSPPAALIFW